MTHDHAQPVNAARAERLRDAARDHAQHIRAIRAIRAEYPGVVPSNLKLRDIDFLFRFHQVKRAREALGPGLHGLLAGPQSVVLGMSFRERKLLCQWTKSCAGRTRELPSWKETLLADVGLGFGDN